jgi:hypothetical protein
MMQIARCLRELVTQGLAVEPLKILELSRHSTDLASYLTEAEITRFATHLNNEPSFAIPLTLPYPDASFDACIVTDAYEHIPEEVRQGLLKEMVRVSRGMVL